MALIVAGCLAWCCGTRVAAASYAPPPPIVLAAPPAPELPPAEYPRRPFEVAPELSLALPSCTEGSADDTRCAGLGAGAGFAGALLWRPSPYFAFGGTFAELRFALRGPESSALEQGSAAGHLLALLGRVYFFDHGRLEPYLELGLGRGSVSSSARQDAVAYDDTSSGLAVRAGAGLEFYLGRHVRLGPAFDWTTFSAKNVRRCGAGRCADLDPGSYGHGSGFTTFSLRVSVLLGPGS